LSNDTRGSGSDEVRKEELKDLGEIHVGRKPVQPPRDELRRFYRKAKPLLDHDTVCFSGRGRTWQLTGNRQRTMFGNFMIFSGVVIGEKQ
jgi:hypothetical protein